MSHKRAFLCAIAATNVYTKDDLKVFAFGGNNGDLDLKEVEVLDLNSEQWSSLAPMKIARNGA